MDIDSPQYFYLTLQQRAPYEPTEREREEDTSWMIIVIVIQRWLTNWLTMNLSLCMFSPSFSHSCMVPTRPVGGKKSAVWREYKVIQQPCKRYTHIHIHVPLKSSKMICFWTTWKWLLHSFRTTCVESGPYTQAYRVHICAPTTYHWRTGLNLLKYDFWNETTVEKMRH